MTHIDKQARELAIKICVEIEGVDNEEYLEAKNFAKQYVQPLIKSALQSFGDQKLEEAAKIADGFKSKFERDFRTSKCADAIRALKSKPEGK